MRKYDVIVVGSGPSGATAAYWCAKNGFSTLIVDENRFPRDKPCAGVVSSRALNHLNFKVDETVKQVYYKARIYRPHGEFFTLKSNSPLAIGVFRSDFDLLLNQKAISEGAIFGEENKVERVLVSPSGVHIRCRKGLEAIGEVLVAADGVNSIIARQVNLREKWNSNEVGLASVWESKIENKALEGIICDSLEFYFGIASSGYGWIFPKGKSLCVGAGILLKDLRSSDNLIPNFIRKVRKIRALKIANPKFHLVPIGGINRRVSIGRTLLVGDAAGFVDPLFGEGIYSAIASGRIAALSIKKALEQGRPNSASTIYDKLCKRMLIPDLKLAHSFAAKVHYHPDMVLGFFLSDEKLCQDFAEVIKGKKNYRDFVKSMWKRIPISTGKRLVGKFKGN
ncbi:NAD(P)/FAD-dependent oxidoreductase [Candidatus Bathyarchaeota archaeon]|nr:NAD(P)/FAD-dependent oxidoreductase [Candidatus Bathyarchaeota archaeon]